MTDRTNTENSEQNPHRDQRERNAKQSAVRAALTARQILERLSPYNLDRVIFQTVDGLPITAITIDTDEQGGAIIALTDTDE